MTAERVIDRPRPDVARVMFDPAREREWIGGIRESRPLGAAAVAPGARTERVASFLGKRIEYVLEVVGHEPDALLHMRSVRAPFPMEVTYALAEDGPGRTRASIRVQGGGRLQALMAPGVRRNLAKDLRRLDALLC